MRLVKSLMLFILALGLSSGCATSPKVQKTYLWPAPPDEPRYVYVDTYYGEADLVEYSIWDRLFGAPLPNLLNHPIAVFASNGKMYVVTPGSSNVTVIDTVKKKVSYLGDSGGGKLRRPSGITGLPDGSLIFVADPYLHSVLGYGPDGNLQVPIGKQGDLHNPVGLAVNTELGRLYVVDSREHKMNVYSLKGDFLFTFGRPGKGDGQFLFPSSVAIQQGSGNVYVVDTQNSRVQKFDRDGKFLDKFGQLGDSAGTFARPKGVAVDSEDHVYVIDAAFDNFQVFNDAQQVLFALGGAGTGPGEFNLPSGICIDEKDRIYVADNLNSRVQVFQYLSEKWKKEHPEEYLKYRTQPETERPNKENSK